MKRRPYLLQVVLALACLGLGGAAHAETTSDYLGRPIYSEPGAGLQLPPGCQVDPTWRARLANGDLEVWIAECQSVVRTWLVRRTVIEVLGNNQARLRFQVVDERQWPGEVAGESTSLQCVGKGGPESAFVVIGAKWRPAGNELRMTGASAVIRADAAALKFAAATVGQVECTRYPDREAMLRRLQQR